jgi:uncharacterized protein YkwD
LVASAATVSSRDTALLREVNRVRVAHGLPALRADNHLQRAAVAHTRDMLESDTFEHGPFGSRMVQYNVSFSIAGENLAWGTGSLGSARSIVKAWLHSPEHRANLLRSSFTRVGIGDLAGSFQGHADAHVVTADFAG